MTNSTITGNERFTELLNELVDQYDSPEALNTAIHDRMSASQWRDRSESAGYDACVHALRRREVHARVGTTLPQLPLARPRSGLSQVVRSVTRFSEREFAKALSQCSTDEQVRAAIMGVPKDALIEVPGVGLRHLREITVDQFMDRISWMKTVIHGYQETIWNYDQFASVIRRFGARTLEEVAYPQEVAA